MKIVCIILCFLLSSCVWYDDFDEIENLPLDDSEYPYAGLPRFVIETDGFEQIRNRETQHSAKLQIYEADAPTESIIQLRLKGRGYSSFEMPKHSYKMEYEHKQQMFGMPQNKDWDLVSNYRDKSMLRNALTYQLAKKLGAPYSPDFRFIELYLNRNYKGVYLLVEHIKVSKNRVNLPKDGYSFLLEKTTKKGYQGKNVVTEIDGETFFFTKLGYMFKVKYPKKDMVFSVKMVCDRFSDFEAFMESDNFENIPIELLAEWIDVDDFIRYYWIQEFSKNMDGAFHRSIYLTWRLDEQIRMGPVWDFDLAYGIGNEKMMSPCDFYIRHHGWYEKLFRNKAFKLEVDRYWRRNKQIFLMTTTEFIKEYSFMLLQVQKNDEKRWKSLNNDGDWPFVEAYPNYNTAVDSLSSWIYQRYDWISTHL